MSRPPKEETRLDTLLENRERVLAEGLRLVQKAIPIVVAAFHASHGVDVFQTRHVAEALNEMEGWRDLGVGDQTLPGLIRQCGYELFNWKTPEPGARVVKVWRRVLTGEELDQILRGEA